MSVSWNCVFYLFISTVVCSKCLHDIVLVECPKVLRWVLCRLKLLVILILLLNATDPMQKLD